MAKIKNGYLIGKVGNIVGARWKNKYYLKKAPVRTAPPSDSELQRRFIFKMVSQWMKPLTPFLRVGFRGYHPEIPAWSAANSLLQREALMRNGYDSSIDPALVRMSFGNVGLPAQMSVSLNAEKQLLFTWETAIDANKDPRDRCLLLAYNIERKEALYELGGPQRAEGQAVLSLDGSPGTWHVYFAFMAQMELRQSHSSYLGTVGLEATPLLPKESSII